MTEPSFATPLTNAQAALGLSQFENLSKRNQKRIDNARWLTEALVGIKGLDLPYEPQGRTHLYTHYAVRLVDRESFVKKMIKQGIDAQMDYCSFCPSLPDFSRVPHETPVSQSLGGKVAYLPNHPSLTKSDMLRIASATKEALNN